MAKKPEGDLVAWWQDNDLQYAWSDKCARYDGRLLHRMFSTERYTLDGFKPSYIEELEKRGLDPKTLRFSIDKKAPAK